MVFLFEESIIKVIIYIGCSFSTSHLSGYCMWGLNCRISSDDQKAIVMFQQYFHTPKQVIWVKNPTLLTLQHPQHPLPIP